MGLILNFQLISQSLKMSLLNPKCKYLITCSHRQKTPDAQNSTAPQNKQHLLLKILPILIILKRCIAYSDLLLYYSTFWDASKKQK